MQDKWFVIINPVSGGKAAPKRWAKIHPLLQAEGIDLSIAYTAYRDHGALLAEEALKKGFRRLMILGGDGSANDVVNGVMRSGVSPEEVIIAMVPAGTGNDWVRSIGKPVQLQLMAKAMQQAVTKWHDVGVAVYDTPEGKGQRYFINIAGLGFEGAVAKHLYQNSGKFYFGKLQYQLAILRTLLRYKHTLMRIQVDDTSQELTVLSIAAGNGKFNGGGLKQLPDALFDDKQLDMTVIATMPKWKMVISLPKLQTGAHTRMQEVRTFTGKRMHIESTPPVAIDVDGEYIGSTPLTLSIHSAQVRVLCW